MLHGLCSPHLIFSPPEPSTLDKFMKMSEYEYESTFDAIQTTQVVKEESPQNVTTGVVLASPETASGSNRASTGDLAAFVRSFLL